MTSFCLWNTKWYRESGIEDVDSYVNMHGYYSCVFHYFIDSQFCSLFSMQTKLFSFLLPISRFCFFLLCYTQTHLHEHTNRERETETETEITVVNLWVVDWNKD